jgi:predicted metalloprotease with PDZ domain
VDAAVIESPLSEALDRVVGAPVDGLLGYSFLRRYRVGIDYARRVVWLDPLPEPWDDRPYEYSHVGIQLERNGAAAEIVAIATDSPAARSGIMVGDTLVAIDATRADQADLEALTRRLEGPPGTPVRIVVQRAGRQITYRLARRRLL